MYNHDNRVVMTLDAGGTNFIFSAIQANKAIIDTIRLPSSADNLEECLQTLTEGFSKVKEALSQEPVAISFAFPGPADYKNGVIGELPNLPAFRKGGVALGAFLAEKFSMPVFINNDGALFAYGEAMAGALPYINERLSAADARRKYHNLLGVTFGTGFGGGVVIDGRLLIGDNCNGGCLWCFNYKDDNRYIAEEGVSIRAVKRFYAEFSGADDDLTPYEIFQIAEGNRNGDSNAARSAFAAMGRIAGDTIAQANTIVDGIVVIGGGLAGASKYFMQPLVDELNAQIATMAGDSFCRSQSRAYNLENPEQFTEFINGDFTETVQVPLSEQRVTYTKQRLFGVMTSQIGASEAIALGAYAFALNKLDSL